MPKLVRVIVYEGPEDWLQHEQAHMSLVPQAKWNVSASVDKGGGGGVICETFRGTDTEFWETVAEQHRPE